MATIPALNQIFSLWSSSAQSFKWIGKCYRLSFQFVCVLVKMRQQSKHGFRDISFSAERKVDLGSPAGYWDQHLGSNLSQTISMQLKHMLCRNDWQNVSRRCAPDLLLGDMRHWVYVRPGALCALVTGLRGVQLGSTTWQLPT